MGKEWNKIWPTRSAVAMKKQSVVTTASTGSDSNFARELSASNKESKVKQISKMILVIMMPVAALIAKASISLVEAIDTQNAAGVLRNVMEYALFTEQGITLLERERGLTTVYMSSNMATRWPAFRRMEASRKVSNEFFTHYTMSKPLRLVSSPDILRTGKDIIVHLNVIRRKVDNDNVTLLNLIEQYSEVNTALITSSLEVDQVPSKENIWPLVVSFGCLSRVANVVGQQSGVGGAAFSGCGLTTHQRNTFQIYNKMVDELLKSAFRFLPVTKQLYLAAYTTGDLHRTLTRQKKYIHNNTALQALCASNGGEAAAAEGEVWTEVISEYTHVIEAVKTDVSRLIEERIPVLERTAQVTIATFMAIVIIVTIVCLTMSVWYAVAMTNFNSKIRDSLIKANMKTLQVKEEKKKTDMLLYEMMPRRVAETMKAGGDLVPEWFDNVTVYFSDVKGWSDMSMKSSPHQIVSLLNELYKNFDDIIEMYDVYKVETNADLYTCASGLPEKNPKHAGEIARLALEMMSFSKTFNISHLPGVPLSLRIGFHSGPCVAGMIGTLTPHYRLFGDTVDTASRMRTYGEAFKIHISESASRQLEKLGGFEIAYRGRIPITGKGELNTYWLIRALEEDSD